MYLTNLGGIFYYFVPGVWSIPLYVCFVVEQDIVVWSVTILSYCRRKMDKLIFMFTAYIMSI